MQTLTEHLPKDGAFHAYSVILKSMDPYLNFKLCNLINDKEESQAFLPVPSGLLHSSPLGTKPLTELYEEYLFDFLFV